jgi:hypothetical protein
VTRDGARATEEPMRYLMIHWIDEAVLAESAAIESEVEAWTAEMDRRGVRLQGEPLRLVSQAATMRIRGGDLLVSDGPFAETKEPIAGFDLIECANMAEAVEIASAHPVATIGTFELRQIWTA